MQIVADHGPSLVDLLTVQAVLSVIDYLFDLVLRQLELLFDLVLRLRDLLFGLARAAVRLAFGFQLLVAGDDSSRLLGFALHLIGFRTHHAPSLVAELHAVSRSDLAHIQRRPALLAPTGTKVLTAPDRLPTAGPALIESPHRT